MLRGAGRDAAGFVRVLHVREPVSVGSLASETGAPPDAAPREQVADADRGLPGEAIVRFFAGEG